MTLMHCVELPTKQSSLWRGTSPEFSNAANDSRRHNRKRSALVIFAVLILPAVTVVSAIVTT